MYLSLGIMSLEQLLQRILLVDDSPDDRLLAIRELNREFPDIEIQEAVSLAEFYQALETDDFDLVITDYELNWTTGLDILRAVKVYDPELPIIMFTNSGTQEIAVEAMKSGLDDYVLKSPKQFMRLSQAVRTVWENTQTRRQAAQLQLRLQFLLNELNVGVFRSTLEGELLEVSDGFLHLLGLSSFEEAQRFFQEQLRFQKIEGSQQEQWKRQRELICPNGQKIWLQISEMLVRHNGKIVIDGLIDDITEEKRAAASLQDLNKTLEQRVEERTVRLENINKELETFAFSVSHDLRSPIRQIDGFVNLLKQQLTSIKTDETVLHYLDMITKLTERSGRMIDDLLLFSRTGRAEMQYTTVNMEQLVQSIKLHIELRCEPRKIIWQIDSLPAVTGDRNLFQQVWQNLLENAVKYSSEKEQTEIHVGSISGDQKITYFVKDNGIGFEMNSVNRLFGIFQRLENAQQFDGSGIGLANVRRIIHRHGGQVWAEGNLGEGATFYFSLPREQPET
ncbi:sensor histidine kinase [Limnoraphis robusta]|uniref:histidine kinase n=1 Tax=Limnoraphis robusta CCNP1315 TaxID=3110306 RepID=A0ABU5TWK8_9CYAN|nr:ATP-binding protein [Limnoraphis robusta]MEA5519175.1 ATP-binding protein [Limnoraphis robusta CCNP1315]MEA5546985.1 ATP-binding protein [Limnoraphis robusta CCNP1324]